MVGAFFLPLVFTEGEIAGATGDASLNAEANNTNSKTGRGLRKKYKYVFSEHSFYIWVKMNFGKFLDSQFYSSWHLTSIYPINLVYFPTILENFLYCYCPESRAVIFLKSWAMFKSKSETCWGLLMSFHWDSLVKVWILVICDMVSSV